MASYRLTFLTCLLLQMASLHAEFGKGLEQERMIVDAGLVFVTSSFAQHDSISCYTQGGKPL